MEEREPLDSRDRLDLLDSRVDPDRGVSLVDLVNQVSINHYN